MFLKNGGAIQFAPRLNSDGMYDKIYGWKGLSKRTVPLSAKQYRDSVSIA